MSNFGSIARFEAREWNAWNQPYSGAKPTSAGRPPENTRLYAVTLVRISTACHPPPAKRQLVEDREFAGLCSGRRQNFGMPRWDLQSGHGSALKQFPARHREPPRPVIRSVAACAVRRDACARIHLPVEFRNKNKRQPRSKIGRTV